MRRGRGHRRKRHPGAHRCQRLTELRRPRLRVTAVVVAEDGGGGRVQAHGRKRHRLRRSQPSSGVRLLLPLLLLLLLLLLLIFLLTLCVPEGVVGVGLLLLRRPRRRGREGVVDAGLLSWATLRRAPVLGLGLGLGLGFGFGLGLG